MLWCKATFQQRFSDASCRLFPTQKQLFDFLDDLPWPERDSRWLPFSIELLSEVEVSEALSRKSASGRTGTQPLPLFRHAPSTKPRERAAQEAAGAGDFAAAEAGHPGKKRARGGVVRQHFSLLYGDAPLSSQSRMFLACTFDGLAAIVQDVESSQLHLYEIIREGLPCHLYFDVEREGDTVSVHRETVITSSSDSCVEEAGPPPVSCASASVEPDVSIRARIDSRSGPRYYRSSRSEYRQLLQREEHTPAAMCPLDCEVAADNSHTTETLLRELDAFVLARYPFLLSDTDVDSEEQQEGSGIHSWVPSSLWRSVQRWARTVVVLRSRPPGGCGPAKFSQHYVVKLREHLFDCNSSAGEFAREFVDFLDQKCVQGDRRIHQQLFFHDRPVLQSILASVTAEQPSSAVPFMARKCVIDTAVYSRNRMMRCLGSCKLHKTSILQVEACLGVAPACRAAPAREDGQEPCLSVHALCECLIAATPQEAAATSLLRIEAVAPRAAGVQVSEQTLLQSSPFADGGTALYADAGTVERLEAAFRKVSGCPQCIVLPVRQLGGKFEVYHVSGSRYCLNISREHKSNGVYIVVDTGKRTWVQKCFDPDCSRFRSPPMPL